MEYRTTRDVTPAECSWLSETVPQGTVLYRYSGCTYGCIKDGVAVSMKDGVGPFFEMPHNALEEIR